MWSLAILLVRNTLKKLRKRNPSIISDFSYGIKTICCIIMIIVWIVDGMKMLFPKMLDDPYFNTIEWVTTFGLSVFIWSFAEDWKN